MPVAQRRSFGDARHPEINMGPAVDVYVWQYPIRLFHWGLVISLAVLSFTGYSIDDVVNNPIAKHALIGYYKLSRQIHRRSECIDLERQWNP